MKYPLENVSVWDLIRHPFDEESGDPGGRTFMRLLSNIFFPIYVFLQLYVPIQLAMDICLDLGPTGPKIEHVEQVGPPAESAVDQAELLVEQNELTGQRKDPVWLTVMYMFFVWIWLVVGFWTIWVILSSFVRFFTSTYFHKLLIVGFYGALCLCTKKGTPGNIKWNERLDAAMTNLDIVKTEMSGMELSLVDIINPSMDIDLVESGISSYMKSLKGKYDSNNISKLFVTLCKTKVLATDTLAHFYRVMSALYTDGKWVTQNVIQKYAREFSAQSDSQREWQNEIMQKHFPQINLDELNTDNA